MFTEIPLLFFYLPSTDRDKRELLTLPPPDTSHIFRAQSDSTTTHTHAHRDVSKLALIRVESVAAAAVVLTRGEEEGEGKRKDVVKQRWRFTLHGTRVSAGNFCDAVYHAGREDFLSISPALSRIRPNYYPATTAPTTAAVVADSRNVSFSAKSLLFRKRSNGVLAGEEIYMYLYSADISNSFSVRILDVIL